MPLNELLGRWKREKGHGRAYKYIIKNDYDLKSYILKWEITHYLKYFYFHKIFF